MRILATAIAGASLILGPGDDAHAQALSQLRADLHAQVKINHRPIGYRQTRAAMESIHQDPVNAENILLFYTGRSQDADLWVNRDGKDGWNREHLWPQSRGVRPFPMKSDLHNLAPTDASVNQRRGNLNFDTGGSAEGEAPDTRLDMDSFEPRDAVKGDVARALFYMDVRYEGTGGEPDLVLVDETTASGGHTMGDLCTLLAWHDANPVTDEDRTKNDAIEAVQGNRNPFIDDPALASVLYGPTCGATTGLADLPQVSTNTLHIGAWNIANLHHEDGVALRDRAIARDAVDYQRLADLAASLALDIVALQEVGSPRAVRRVFPETDYHLVMSDRYGPGDENRSAELRDIYTAMVFSKARFPEAPTASTLTSLAIDHIALDRDGQPSVRSTRAGIVADVEIAGQRMRLLGVHLKSSCHRWPLDPVEDQSQTSGRPFDSRFDCRTLAAQRAILENWLELQAALEVPVVVLGDFNRRMNAEDSMGEPSDQFWRDINDGTPNALAYRKGPLGIDEVCWPEHDARFEDHIDFIVYDETLLDFASTGDVIKHSMGFEADPRYDEKQRQRLSDHCPVTMTITW